MTRTRLGPQVTLLRRILCDARRIRTCLYLIKDHQIEVKTSVSSATCDTKGKLQLCLLALIPVYQGLNSSYYVTEYRVNFLKSSKHCVTLELCSAIKELIFGWLWKSHEHYKHWRVAAALFDCLKLRWSKLRPLRCHCLKICFWLPCLTVNESNQRYVSVCDTVAMFEFKNFEVYESQQMWLFLSSVTSLPCRRNYKPRYRSLVSSATLDIGYIPCIYVTFEFIEASWRFHFHLRGKLCMKTVTKHVQ